MLIEHKTLYNSRVHSHNFPQHRTTQYAQPEKQTKELCKRKFELKVITRCNYERNTDLVGIIVQKAKTMKLECITYKLSILLTIETERASYWLIFVRIDNLLVLDNLKFVVIQCYKTRVFNEFLNAYKTTEDVGKKNIIILRDLENKMPLPSAIIKRCEYIMTHHCTFSNGPY